MFTLLKEINRRQNVPEPDVYPVAPVEWVKDAVYNSSATTTGAEDKTDPLDDGQSSTPAVGATWKNYAGTVSYTATAIVAGCAMVYSSGKLVRATGTTKPKFITIGVEKGGYMPAYRVSEKMRFLVETSADPSSLKPGAVVTVGADGLTATATTSSGVLTITDTNGAAASGDQIIVKI